MIFYEHFSATLDELENDDEKVFKEVQSQVSKEGESKYFLSNDRKILSDLLLIPCFLR